jgi:hypothetical protein
MLVLYAIFVSVPSNILTFYFMLEIYELDPIVLFFFILFFSEVVCYVVFV